MFGKGLLRDSVKRSGVSFGYLVIFFFSLLNSFHILHAPEPLPENAPPQKFSARRAFNHIRELARAPREPGSQNHQSARQYIMDVLQNLGLHPQVQQSWLLLNRVGSEPIGVHLNNIVARLPGKYHRPALLLVAHYDTNPNSPGAGDDTAGVATLLETARVLSKSPKLPHDVIFLFTDGEELGLLGARAFVKSHPWYEEVGLVLNFDVRGSRGPVIMFQTSPRASYLIHTLAQMQTMPVATSLTDTIYRHMPNNTDLTMFLRDNKPGLNFAFIGGPWTYHTPLDRPENLSLSSLQHMGANAAYLSQALNSPIVFDRAFSEDVTYFNLTRRVLVMYPLKWVPYLAILILLLYVVFVVWFIQHNKKPFTGLVYGFFYYVSAIAAVAFLAECLLLLYRFIAHRTGILYPLWPTWPVLIGMALWVSGLFIITWSKLSTLITSIAQFMIVFGIWVGITLLTSFLLPGAAYLFLWPALGVLVGFFWLQVIPKAGLSRLIPFAVALYPVVCLWVPVLVLVHDAMTLKILPWTSINWFLILSLIGLCQPLERARAPKLWAGSFIVMGFVLILAEPIGAKGVPGLFGLPENPTRHEESLFLLVDVDGGKAYWSSTDNRPGPWNQLYLGPSPTLFRLDRWIPNRPESMWMQPLPKVPTVTFPEIKVGYFLENPPLKHRLTIRPTPGTTILRIFFTPGENVRSLIYASPLGPVTVNRSPSRLPFRFTVLAPRENETLFLDLAPGRSVQAMVVGVIPGFPEELHITRPEDTIPPRTLSWLQDHTVIVRSQHLSFQNP